MTDDRPIMETQVPNDPVRNTPKFSRYKSVRRAAAAAAAAAEQQQQQQQQQNAQANRPAVKPKSETIARSMSRYRRPRTATTGTAAVDSPAVPAIPPSTHILSAANKTWHGMKSHEAPACPSIGSKGTTYTGSQRESKEDEGEQQEEEEEEELSAAEKARLREEAMRTLTMAEGPPRTAPARAHAPAPAVSGSRDLVEQNRRLKPEGEVSHHRRASWKERLGLSRQKTSADPLHRSEANQGSVEPSGKGIVAGIDAPLSAVNAGERRVLIKYKSTSFDLPVTPTTRAKDLIYSAVKCFSEYVDPRTAIILETFSSLGLERPIRRYEHIRDVLNSWATDDANCLVVCESPHEGAHESLKLKAAPSGQPADRSFCMYYSSKPGKWDKRHITLRTDGQVVLSKKPNAKEAKDFTNICHISDFDIYTPTARQISKKLKPPKKICFAIKSQQKSSMFLSTENFVHFFATNDSDVAQGWHDAVHGWRSWYLAHVVKLDEKYQEAMKNQKTMTPTDSHGPPIPHQVSTKPLVDFGRNADLDEKPTEKRSTESPMSPTSTREMFLRSKKAREKAPPPSAFQSNLPKVDVANSSASEQDDDSTFLPDSLLGRTYSQRQAAQREREAREANDNEPFISHGLLKNMSPLSPIQSSNAFVGSSVHHTVRSPTQSEGVSQSRSSSVRHKPKPLVDLTPVYQEPPQHARKGHGVRIEPGRPLVEAATGLESVPGVPDIPPATTWKREQARPATAESSAASIAPRRGNTIKSTPHRDFTTSSSSPFVPNGLLAQTGNSASYMQAKTGSGRGVATGHRDATRPLLDMTPTSEFVEGSLLRNMERQA